MGGGLPKGEYFISGGFPCQDLSTAGKGGGLNAERSGLFYEYIRLISEIRPSIAIMENVSALLGWFDEGKPRYEKDNKEQEWEAWQYQGIARVTGCLSEIGYNAEWQVISASAVGASHQRERVWIITYPSSERQQAFYFQNRIIKKKLSKMRGEKIDDNLGRIVYSKNKRIPIEYFFRKDDGLSEELDSIRGLGNAIVPQCAELIFNLPAFDRWRGYDRK